MRFSEISIRQSKSSIKAGEGLECGTYKFFTSGVSQSKFLNEALYHGPALIFGTGGSPSVHYCEEDFSTSTDCLVYYPSDESIDFYCAYLFFKSHIYLLEKGFRGAGLKHIKKDYIENIEINWPNEDRRNVINTTSKKIDFLAAKRKEQLDKLNILSSALFYEMFGDPIENERGWATNTIQGIAEKYTDGPFGSNLKSEHYQQFGIRVIRLQNIGVNEFIDLDKAFISEEHYDTLTKYTCRPGDIVIGTLGAPNLRACIIPQNIERAVNKADCVLCRVRKELMSEFFLCHVLNEKRFVDAQCQLFCHGETRARISAGQLKNTYVPVPPLPLQQEFAEKVADIEKQKELIRNSLQKLELLKNSLMQQYFA